jgi:hypothetical protein
VIRRPIRSALAIGVLVAVSGCRASEPPEAIEARTRKVILEGQITELGRLIGKTRRGELVTEGQIAVGVSEGLVQRLLTASLPPERVVGGRLHVSLGKVEPFFRGGLAVIRIRARVSSADIENATADFDIVSGLKNIRLENGRLVGRVSIHHIRLLSTFVGEAGKNLIEGAIRTHQAALEDLIPRLEIPVMLEEEVNFGGIQEGPVQVGAGRLPLKLALSHVVPVNERLWLLVRAEAGAWEAAPEPEKEAS